MRSRTRLLPVVVVLAIVLGPACGSEQTAEPPVVTPRETALVPHDRPDHASLCEPSRRFAGERAFPCGHDSDCVACGCEPVNQDEYERVGGREHCERFNVPPAREECVATNGAACCDFACVLVR